MQTFQRFFWESSSFSREIPQKNFGPFLRDNVPRVAEVIFVGCWVVKKILTKQDSWETALNHIPYLKFLQPLSNHHVHFSSKFRLCKAEMIFADLFYGKINTSLNSRILQGLTQIDKIQKLDLLWKDISCRDCIAGWWKAIFHIRVIFTVKFYQTKGVRIKTCSR